MKSHAAVRLGDAASASSTNSVKNTCSKRDGEGIRECGGGAWQGRVMMKEFLLNCMCRIAPSSHDN